MIITAPSTDPATKASAVVVNATYGTQGPAALDRLVEVMMPAVPVEVTVTGWTLCTDTVPEPETPVPLDDARVAKPIEGGS